MGKTFSIFKKEAVGYLTSPLAYVFIATFLLISGYTFWAILLESRQAHLRETFEVLSSLLLFLTPMLTMRLLSEEKKSGTIELLFTSPLSPLQIVLGKFFACFCVFLVIFTFTLAYPLTVYTFGSPDIWPIVGGYIGLLLLAACYTSIGLLASALSENQLISVVISFAMLLFFWMIYWAKDFIRIAFFSNLVRNLSFLEHFEGFGKGIISLPDIVYFFSFISLCIFLSGKILELQRNK